MVQATIAEIQKLLLDAAANKATAEAGQTNAERISEINTALAALSVSQKEISTTTTRVESSLTRVIQANTAMDQSVADLKQSMERVATRLSSMEKFVTTLSTPEHADLCPEKLRPHGHRKQNQHQGVGSGEDRTSGHTLVISNLIFSV